MSPRSRPETQASPPLPARYYGLLCERMKQLGIDVAAVLRAAGIPAATIRARDGVLSLRKVEALLAAAFARSGREDLGIELGLQIKLSSHDILGFAFLSSPTFDHVLRLAARYFRLKSPLFTLEHRRSDDAVELTYRPVVAMSARALRFHCEAIVASVHAQMASSVGRRMAPYDVHLFGPRPPHRRYRDLAPARVHFDSEPMPGLRIVIAHEIVDGPMEHADRRALEMAEARCAQLVRQAGEAGSMAEWVEMMLREARGGMPTLGDLARILHIGPHTLERRLRAEGRRFLDIAGAVRHRRAREMLARGDLTVTQVAYELGYRDASNFTRAFRREGGLSPSAFAQAAARRTPRRMPSGTGKRAAVGK